MILFMNTFAKTIFVNYNQYIEARIHLSTIY